MLSRDSQTQVLDLSTGTFQFVRSCMHAYFKLTHLSAINFFANIQPTLSRPVDLDAGAAHNVDDGPSNSEADNITNTTTTILGPAGLGQVRPNESTSRWNYVGRSSTSISALTLTGPLNDVAVASPSDGNASQELKLLSETRMQGQLP